MKRKTLTKSLAMLTAVLALLVLMFGSLKAQNISSTSTSSSAQSSSANSSGQTGATVNGYEVDSSFEIGARGLSVDGSDNKYRSDLNYRPGFRLFDSSFLAKTKDSKGKPFDTFLVTGSGWNADPNGITRINVEKVGWYRFDGAVRRFTYFNNLANLALNEHTRHTKHTMGDFDVTFLPQNENLKVRFGYSFDRNRGPVFTTYDYQRDEFPIDSDLQSRSYDMRFGIDAKLLGFNVSFTEGFRRFRDNTIYTISGLRLGNNPSPNSSLSAFRREQPDLGRTFYNRFSIRRTFAKRLNFTGRFIYSQATSHFSTLEAITGRDSSGNIIVLDQLNVDGDSKRPNGVGDLGATFRVTDKFRISNTFSVNSYRITGGNLLLETLLRRTNAGATLPPVITNTLAYRLTNFRRYMNTIEGDYDFNHRLSAYLGYRYTKRRVILDVLDRNIAVQPPTGVPSSEEFENNTNALIAGFKAQPIKKRWTMYFDVEHGTADNVFTRLANYDYTTFRLRNHIVPTNNFSLNFSIETKDNTNPSRTETVPPRDFGADVNTRIYSASFNWSPVAKFTLDGGYTYNRIASQVTVLFPVNNVVGQGVSRYFLRDNFAYLDGFVQLHPRVAVFGSYRITKDTGRDNLFTPATYTIIGSFPLKFQSPEVRVIFKINRRVDWNVGYQYYDYKEKFQSNQNYRAHLPYTSLRIYLGEDER